MELQRMEVSLLTLNWSVALCLSDNPVGSAENVNPDFRTVAASKVETVLLCELSDKTILLFF